MSSYEMSFQTGGRAVTVVVGTDDLATESGMPANALVDGDRDRVTLAGDGALPPESRLPVLCHELAHVHEWRYGSPPPDPEERMDWMASYAVWIVRELARNAGLPMCEGEQRLQDLHPQGPAVIGHTRPDIAEVVRELAKRSPDWNRSLTEVLRKRPAN